MPSTHYPNESARSWVDCTRNDSAAHPHSPRTWMRASTVEAPEAHAPATGPPVPHIGDGDPPCAVLRRIEQAVPGTRAHFNGHGWADLWPQDPWTKGSYAACGIGQYTQYRAGTAQPEGDAHFAGEATSTHSQGYLNGGVESGYRAAIEVMRKLRIAVPPAFARLPYSPA